MRAFILAGGLGTRLRPVSGETPKALMPIAGQPFLHRLVARLVEQGFVDIVLCLGHRAEAIASYFAAHRIPGATVRCSVETESRGTAGALRVAAVYWQTHNLIMNGDTDLTCDYSRFAAQHLASGNFLTIGLAHMADASRYGRVECDAEGRVLAFSEKDGATGPGLVNAGLYVAARDALEVIPADTVFSIEREWLPGLLRTGGRLNGLVVANSFIDIGTPEDYWRLANQA